jgi:hypothetical protein
MTKTKEATRERIETMLGRAVSGSRQLGLDDAADRYADMSVDDYADEKGIVIINPLQPRSNGSKTMKNVVEIDEAELEDLEAAEEDADTAEEVLASIWDKITSVGTATKKDELLCTIDEIADEINAYDPEEFAFADEEDEAA